jgi:heme O synthase-like polyprenyltransferase
MAPELFGIEHIIYIIISTILGGISLFFAYKYIKNEKAQSLFLKVLAIALFISVMTNRVSQVFRYDTVRWYCIIPDSFCAMTSLVLSLAVIF